MKTPNPPPDEARRLQALRDYRILDTPAEAVFDGLTKLAARLLGVPIALVSLVDSDRQWFKSRYGLDAPETTRDISFCGHVVEHDRALVVPDATADPCFFDNPLVTDGPRVGFYAGTPLRTSDGHVLGTLCVIDHVPKVLSEEDRDALEILADQVMAQLELRRQNLVLANHQKVQHELQRSARNTAKSQDVLQQTMHLHLHRNLQLAVELIEMQIASLPLGESRASLKACVGRLHAIAAVHMLGARTNHCQVPLAAYVRRVAHDVFDASQPTPEHLRLQCVAEDMDLPIEIAIPCGLVLNELIVNAAAHASSGGKRGTIHVEVNRVGADKLRVCVADDGSGLLAGFDPRNAGSVGMRTIVTLADRLGASLQTDSAAGTSFAMLLPLRTA